MFNTNIRCLKSIAGKYVAEGMLSSEGEYVEFLRPVALEGQVESWLCHIGEFNFTLHFTFTIY